MQAFLQCFAALVCGVLPGFDRLRFRGSKRQLCQVAGTRSWRGHTRILLKDYPSFVADLTASLQQAIEVPAQQEGLYQYLNNCQVSKEETALPMTAQHGHTQGLIAVLGCVEPCQTLRVHPHRHTKKLELRAEWAKCKHYYHYYLDPLYGLRYTRLQTWFPFTMHAGLNGRDWLAQELMRAGIGFVKKDNCFTWIEDCEAAQKLADAQQTTAWPVAETLLPAAVPY